MGVTEVHGCIQLGNGGKVAGHLGALDPGETASVPGRQRFGNSRTWAIGAGRPAPPLKADFTHAVIHGETYCRRDLCRIGATGTVIR